MTRKEIMIKVREFWYDNMSKRISYLYDGLSNEQIVDICKDLIKISKNFGVYTGDLQEEFSCSSIPEMSASTPNSDVRKYLKRFIAMVYGLMDLCGHHDDCSLALKKKYCSDLNWNSISDAIDSIRKFRYDLFKRDGMFDNLIAKCEELDKGE
jgi:hypothetical protein